MKKLMTTLIIAGFITITLNACSTVAGVGKDLQKAGQVVENEARKH